MANGEPKTYADGVIDGLRQALHNRSISTELHPLEIAGLRNKILDLEERLEQLERRFPIEVEEKIYIKPIPLGTWDLEGNWSPSNDLKMSHAEQYQHNLINGFFEKTS